jgi:hypothetical protein
MMIVMVLPTIAPSYQIEKLDAEKERYGDRQRKEKYVKAERKREENR